MTRVIRPEAPYQEKLWNLILNQSNVDGWKKKLIIQNDSNKKNKN